MTTIVCDLDDTIIATNALYRDALDGAAKLLSEIGVADHDTALTRIGEVDLRNASTGFHRSRFPSSMVEAYKELAAAKEYRTFPGIEQQLYAIGDAVFTQKPVVHPDAIAALSHMHKHYKTILITKGDLAVQWHRIEEAGIGEYFDMIHVVPDKTVPTYSKLLALEGVDPSTAWMIGDSIKSDINPMLTLGAQAVCVRYHDDIWAFEQEDAVGHYHSAVSLTEAMHIIEGVV